MVKQYEELRERFKRYLIAKKRYWKGYCSKINTFLSYCHHAHIDYFNLTLDDLNKYLIFSQRRNGNGGLNNCIVSIRSFYKFLLENELCDDKISQIPYKVKMYKTEEKMKPHLLEKELEEILDVLPIYLKNLSRQKLEAVIYFLFYTGLRCPSELTKLKREEINLNEMSMLVSLPTKNNIERIVPFPVKVRDLLIAYFKTEEEDFNAFNLSGRQLEWITRKMDYLSDKKINGYIFRHSFAMLLVRKGVDVAQAQILLGHKNINSTLVYYKPSSESAIEAYRNKIK